MKNHSLTRCLFSIAILISLHACGGKTSSDNSSSGGAVSVTPASTILKLESSGEIPKLDRSDSLAGPDTNHNGVRDDIDAYIQKTFQDPQQRAAVTQSARAMQSAITVDVTNPEATAAVSKSISRSTHCMFARFSDNQGALSPIAIDEKIEAITANTKARMKAYLAYNKSRNGTVSSLPKGDTCD